MKTDFKNGDRIELMATIINPDGAMGRKVVDDRGTIIEQVNEFTYRVKLDGEVEPINCFVEDLRPLNAADLLAESLEDGP